MGTNYYLMTETDRLHIGKSSAGWRFLANSADMETSHWFRLRERLRHPSGRIVDEYGDPADADRLIRLIRDRAWSREHAEAHARHGPVDFYHGEFS